MSESEDGEDAEEEPAVELGEGEPVEGAPLARITARLSFPIEQSRVERREGDTVLRTPDGPRTLADVLADVDVPYFESSDEFTSAVRDAMGTGPIPTE